MRQALTGKQWNYKHLFVVVISTLVVIALGLGACAKEEPTPTRTSTAQYVLRVVTNPSEGGSVSPSGGSYQSGTEVILTATSSPKYQFDHWSVGGDEGYVNPIKVTMTGNKLVIAYFMKDRYTLSTSVSPSGSGSVSPGGGSYKPGAEANLTATPSPEYQFDHWGVNGNDSDVNPMKVTMNSDKLVTAYFVKTQYTLTTSVTPSGSGSVSPDSGTYGSGDSVTLTATPASGFTFDHWDSDDSGTSPSVTITMDSDKSIIAHFKKAVPTFTLVVVVMPTNGGHVSINPDGGTYDSGTVVTLLALPQPGYQFAGWSGDIPTVFVQTVEITMNADKRVVAHFGRSGS